MKHGYTQMIGELPRRDLEDFAVRMAMELRHNREDRRRNDVLLATLTGFMFGVLVAVSGFLFGNSLG